MAARSIVIDLLLKTGSFETDTKRGSKALKEFQKDVEATGKAIGVGLAAAVVGGAVAIDQLIKSAGEFKDIEEIAGGSAESFASLTIAAAGAGVSMESIVASSIKLTKGLTGVDDESKAAGAALAALGLNVADFKKLDPVSQYEAVGKALAGFADGAGKTAIAVALFGKAGAEQLKVFKSLEDLGGRQVVLTEAQIKAADDYGDAQAIATAQLKQYAQVAAIQFLPAITDTIAAVKDFAGELIGVDSASKTLIDGKGLTNFADDVAKAVAFVVDQLDLMTRLFLIAGKATGGYWATIAAGAQLNFGAAKTIALETVADINAIIDKATFGDKLRAQIAARPTNAANAKFQSDPTELARRGRGASLPQLAFNGATKTAKPARQTEAEKYLETLQKQLEKTTELGELEKALANIEAGRLAGLTEAGRVAILNTASQIDVAKRLADQKKLDDEALKVQNKLVEQNYESYVRAVNSVLTPLEQLRQAQKQISDEAANNPFFSDDRETQLRLETKALIDYANAAEYAGPKVASLGDQIADVAQNDFGQLFDALVTGTKTGKDAIKDFADNVIKDLLRIAEQKAIASLFNGKAEQGSGGQSGMGWLSAISSFFSGSGFADGGRPPVGQASLVGERGPEMFVPNTAGRIVPNSALGGGRGTNVTIENHGARIEKQQASNGDVLLIIDAAVSKVAQQITSGQGQVAQGLKSRGLSLNGNLARRA